MKRTLKFFVAFLLSLFILPYASHEEFSFATEESATTVEPKFSNFFLNVRSNGEFVEDSVSFTITGNGETKQYNTVRGSIFPKFRNDVEYTISLNENNLYTMDPIIVVARKDLSGFTHLYSNGEVIDLDGLFLRKKATVDNDNISVQLESTLPEESESAFLQYISVKYKNRVISDEVKFDIVDKSTGVVVKTVATSRSMINGVELDSSKEYIFKLQDNAKYSFTPLDFKFSYDDGFGEYIPVKTNGEQLLSELILEEKVVPQPANPVNKRLDLPIESDEESVIDPLTFVISKEGGDTISVTSKFGKISPILRVKDGDAFNITLNENEQYVMESLRFVYKLNSAGNLLPFINGNIESQLVGLILNKKQVELPQDDSIATIPQFSIVDKISSELVSEEITFIFTEKETNEQKEVVSNNGKLPELKLKKEKNYVVTVKENNSYTMQQFEFYVMSDGYPFNDETFEEIRNIAVEKVASTDTTPIHKILELTLVDGDGEPILESLNFVITNDDRNITKEYVSENGKLPRVDMYEDENYTFSLKDNDKYTMNDYHLYTFMAHYPINLDDPNERYIDKLILERKPLNTENSSQPTETEENSGGTTENNITNIPVLLVSSTNPQGEIINENITIELYDYEDGELVKTIDVVNGQINNLELNYGQIYVAKVVGDKYRLAEEYILGVNFSKKIVRMLIDPSLRTVDFDKFTIVDKSEQRTAINIPVYHKGAIITEPITFELIVPELETLRVTTKDGILTSRLLEEDYDYYIRVVSDKYETEFFPIVIKQKPQGKFPYNHLNCRLVERITLNNKDNNMKPMHKIENKAHNVSVLSEFNFSDLRMDVEKVDKTSINSLADRDVDIYNISFKNIYRGGENGELVTLSPEKEYKVTIKKQVGKDVVKVYYVSNEGNLTEHQFTQTEDTVTFTTNHFSNYAIEYAKEASSEKNEDNVVTSSTTETNENTKPTLPPKYVVKNNNVTVTGIDFAGYDLVANKVNETVASLSNYMYDLYDIYFVDSVSKEKVDMQEAKYTVTVPKRSGYNVSKVYYVSDSGELVQVSLKEFGCYTATFETTHFSKYVLVYEAITNNSSNVSVTRPCDKPQNADGTRPCDKPQNADGTRPCDKPQNADGTRPCDKPQNADGTRPCDNPNNTCSLNNSSTCNGVSSSCSSSNLSCDSTTGDCKLKSSNSCSEKGCLANLENKEKNNNDSSNVGNEINKKSNKEETKQKSNSQKDKTSNNNEENKLSSKYILIIGVVISLLATAYLILRKKFFKN